MRGGDHGEELGVPTVEFAGPGVHDSEEREVRRPSGGERDD